ncbi:MAG: TlpA disulfide reductase family protein [Pseudomonadota bacterium]
MIRPLLLTLAILVAGTASASPPPLSFESDGMTHILNSEAGKPFVLIIWSLDCSYCQASIANLAAAQQQDDGLEVVTLSTDALSQPGNAEAIRARLAQLGIRGGSWAYGDAPAAQLRYVIDPKWRGETPRSYWYNRHGERIAVHSGLISTATAPAAEALP